MGEKPGNASLLNECDSPEILNSLADGAYITDRERRIVFWNRAAQRITGWAAAEVVGRACGDNILVHVDKDGHALCGHEHCPLHRSIVTGKASQEPLLVFAQHRSGARTPVEVTVSPIRNRAGEIIGGIEIFRDLTLSMRDQWHARNIQKMAVQSALPEDDRVAIETRYEPRDIIGGDFYRVERLDGNRYAVLVADAMGHGIAAALNTMQLRSLWNEHRSDLAEPTRFIQILNERLHAIIDDAGYFGTAFYATYDAATGELRCVRAGHPAPFLFRGGGAVEAIGCTNPALGLLPDTTYRETVVQMQRDDVLLVFTDGAIKLLNDANEELRTEGLKQLVVTQVKGSSVFDLDLLKLEERLLGYSNQIHLPDDLTLLKLLRRC